MALSSGARLGPYEVLAAVGAGGGAEVCRARDTRPDRTLAIKILPPEVSAYPDRRARFEREAKTIAGLSDPHSGTFHDVGEQDGSLFIVMEHVAGQTLAASLEKGRCRSSSRSPWRPMRERLVPCAVRHDTWVADLVACRPSLSNRPAWPGASRLHTATARRIQVVGVQ